MDNVKTMSYDAFTAEVKSAFITPANPVRAHYDLFQRRQQSCETVSEFMSGLRTLMADCEFCGDCSKRMLATMHVVGCNSQATQEKLLTERQIDFDKFVDVLKAEESAREACTHIQNGQSEVMSVNKIKRYPPPPKKHFKRVPSPAVSDAPESDQNTCTHCGWVHRNASCPAKGSTCHKCGGTDHWARVCKSAANSEATIGKVRICQPKSSQIKNFQCSVQLKSGYRRSEHQTAVDTCSDINTITWFDKERVLPNARMYPIPQGNVPIGLRSPRDFSS